ncbi:MAG: hypothetical protein KO318_01520 [Methanobacterium sp.]|jgi:hypothetical protein|uniref:UPF0146 family protein n=1 Tax=Methanobacterium sp. TaxID=2164 RepID=UPI00258C8D82|nr:UPF0146 family protein [Methanobacterium sp.]MCC7559100.1 hypothetical protein [Methanobacterium sp.]
MWSDFTEYIIKHYSQSSRIVEVAVGRFPEVGCKLKKHLKGDIILTDIKPYHDWIILDDIRQPDLKIYKDAGLIYSIRPPEELHPYLENLSREIGADLIIKPLSTDSINTKEKMNLVNFKKAVFYKKSFK